MPAPSAAVKRASNVLVRGGVLSDVCLTRHLRLKLEVLQRVKPAAPSVLRIAKKRPRSQHPQDVDADHDHSQPAYSVVIVWPQDELHTQQTLDRIR